MNSFRDLPLPSVVFSASSFPKLMNWANRDDADEFRPDEIAHFVSWLLERNIPPSRIVVTNERGKEEGLIYWYPVEGGYQLDIFKGRTSSGHFVPCLLRGHGGVFLVTTCSGLQLAQQLLLGPHCLSLVPMEIIEARPWATPPYWAQKMIGDTAQPDPAQWNAPAVRREVWTDDDPALKQWATAKNTRELRLDDIAYWLLSLAQHGAPLQADYLVKVPGLNNDSVGTVGYVRVLPYQNGFLMKVCKYAPEGSPSEVLTARVTARLVSGVSFLEIANEAGVQLALQLVKSHSHDVFLGLKEIEVLEVYTINQPELPRLPLVYAPSSGAPDADMMPDFDPEERPSEE